MLIAENERKELWERKQREAKESYELGSSAYALYGFLLTGNGGHPFSKDRPATQKEVIDALPKFYEANETKFNKDLSRSIYDDVDSINKSDKPDWVVVRTKDYRYYIAQSQEELKEYALFYEGKKMDAIIRENSIESKFKRSGQGKLLSSTSDPHPLTEDCKPFHEPLPEKRAEDDEYYQPSITE